MSIKIYFTKIIFKKFFQSEILLLIFGLRLHQFQTL